ncbi:MAG: ankyrin repeat domain-containing protein, partial [Planctomycetaceae bacterium]|nr:ankyrin repeat domain-containing protein [Planctomycetaceae bacterium]
ETPLFNAIHSNNLEVVKCFVEKGADISTRNNAGKTPLDVIKSEDVAEILRNAGGKSGKDIQ